LHRGRSGGCGLEAISAMTDLKETEGSLEFVTGPSRCPGAAPEKFWVWPMPMTRLLALTIIVGVPALMAVLLGSALP
jgi:hypothetical protein